jgi:hypothetical protein
MSLFSKAKIGDNSDKINCSENLIMNKYFNREVIQRKDLKCKIDDYLLTKLVTSSEQC